MRDFQAIEHVPIPLNRNMLYIFGLSHIRDANLGPVGWKML